MILAEIDLTATKILTPGFDIGRLPRGTAGGRRETRRRRTTDERAEIVYDCILNPRGRLASL